LRWLFSFFHQLFPEALSSPNTPDFLDVGQTFCFRTSFASILPTQRIFPLCRPDRILLFMIHNDLVNRIIFSLFHTVSPCVVYLQTVGTLLFVNRFHLSQIYSPVRSSI